MCVCVNVYECVRVCDVINTMRHVNTAPDTGDVREMTACHWSADLMEWTSYNLLIWTNNQDNPLCIMGDIGQNTPLGVTGGSATWTPNYLVDRTPHYVKWESQCPERFFML